MKFPKYIRIFKFTRHIPHIPSINNNYLPLHNNNYMSIYSDLCNNFNSYFLLYWFKNII